MAVDRWFLGQRSQIGFGDLGRGKKEMGECGDFYSEIAPGRLTCVPMRLKCFLRVCRLFRNDVDEGKRGCLLLGTFLSPTYPITSR